jgi:hypothetical protein
MAIHATLEAEGCRRIELNVFASNPSALALYRSLGYVVGSYEMACPLPLTGPERTREDSGPASPPTLNKGRICPQ